MDTIITADNIVATLSLDDIRGLVGAPGRLLSDSECDRIRAGFARHVAARLKSSALGDAYSMLAYDVGLVLLRLNDWASRTAGRARLRRELDECAGPSGPRDGCRGDPSGFTFCRRHNDQAHRDEINCPPTPTPNLLEIRQQLSKSIATVRQAQGENSGRNSAKEVTGVAAGSDGPITVVGPVAQRQSAGL